LREEPVGVLFRAQVGLQQDRSGKLGRQRFRTVAAAMVVEREPGAFSGERARAGRADATGGARNEHGFAGETRMH
jgi:hypothetical protein